MLAVLLALPRLDFVERWSAPASIQSLNANEPSFKVVGGRIFYSTGEYKKPQVFACLDAATGRRLWRTTGPVSTDAAIAATADHLVVATENDVLQLDPKTGRILWRAHRESYRAGPVISGDRMFYEDQTGRLRAIDLRSHRALWERRYPFGLTAGFRSTSVLGESLLFSTGDGAVVKIAQRDGTVQWRTPVETNRIFRFVGMGGSVLVVGERFVALRLRDGRKLWQAEDGVASSMAYVPKLHQVWSIPEDGRLYRVSAVNGKRLGASSLGPETEHGFFSPVPYQDGYLLPTRRSILKLDSRGGLAASFDTEDDVSEFEPLGPDLLVRAHDRFVRLTPGVPPLPKDVAGLLRKPLLSPEERRSVVRLGRAAVGPLVAAMPEAKGDRLAALKEMLYFVAEARDTPTILALMKRTNGFEHEGFPGYLSEWLLTKGDPRTTADALLPLFQAAKDERAQFVYLPYVVRGTSDAVVDDLLPRLRDPATSASLKFAIYTSIAASGRPDVLATIRAIRAQGRTLTKPNALSPTADHDHDGIPDATDANPFVAPRPLNDIERVLFAVFDARFRFDERTSAIGQIDYGRGIRPFELLGWQGGLVPEDRMKEARLNEPQVPARSYRYPFVHFSPVTDDGTMVVFAQGGSEATADIGVTYGGLDGIGYRAKLRKFGGEWYVVSLTQTWIS